MMASAVWNAVLALVWAALGGGFSGTSLAIGFVLGYAALWLSWPTRPRPDYFRRGPRILRLLGLYAWDVVVSSVRVAHDVLTPAHRSRPAILAVPLDARTDVEIALLANLITMTPGSLALDVSADRRVLYIHAMFVDDPDACKRSIKDGLERRLLEVLR